MKLIRFSVYPALLLIATFPALADTKADAPAVAEEVQIVEGATCSHGKDERRLETLTKDAGCVLHYTKFGQTKKIGEAKRGVELCREKMKGVKTSLEKAGYKCQ